MGMGIPLASSVRVRKLTEEHPEVESLLKLKSITTVELQDDIQKRYCILYQVVLLKCSVCRKLGRMEAVCKLRAEQKNNSNNQVF